MAEKHVEQYLRTRVMREGGLCLKWVSPSRNGVADRICISANGFTYYVETKFGRNGLSPQQVIFKNDLAERGITLYVLASKEQVDQFMNEIYF